MTTTATPMTHTAPPWTLTTDGALTPETAGEDWRPTLEGVIDYDPEGAFDGVFYGFQVSGADGQRGIAIVEWHGDECDAEDRANLRLILAAPKLLKIARQIQQRFADEGTYDDELDAAIAEVEGRS